MHKKTRNQENKNVINRNRAQKQILKLNNKIKLTAKEEQKKSTLHS